MRNWRKTLARVLVITLMVSTVSISDAGTDHHMEEILNTVQDMHIVGIGRWDTGDDVLDDELSEALLCIVTSSINTRNEPEDHLMFWGKHDQDWRKYKEYHLAQSFDAMFTLPCNQHFVTYWFGFSYFMIRIFSIVDHHIQMTLEESPGCMPEFLDVDHDGIQEIILCEPWDEFMVSGAANQVTHYPETALIYRWDGRQYTVWKTVPWKERLCAGSRAKE